MKFYQKILAAALAAGMMLPSAAFAAVHDGTEDNSSDTATVTLGKVLTASQDNKFPAVSDFTFEIEAVRGWDNANVNASESGADISPDDMPKPAASSAAHHTVTVSGNKATVTVGDFGSGTASDGGVADTATQKLRTTGVSIPFRKAGYYLYKVAETGSVPAEIPGVTYDDNSYYIVVYVCNKTDAQGNTLEGVYVHDITSWRNAAGDDAQPDLSDIANTTDNGGTAASENTADQYSKVGISSPTPGTDPDGNPTGPDKLAAYRFWNEQNTHDVVVTNNVTGNLGDITKEFEYDITLTGLEKGVTYTTDVATPEETPQSTSEGADLVSASVGTADPSAKTFTADENGNATLLVRLKDDETLVMNALPVTAKYTVNEKASDHVPDYVISADGEEAVIAKTADAKQTDNNALSTEEETVNPDDGTVTVAFTNHRDLSTPTGVPRNAVPISAAGVLALGIFLVLKKHRPGIGE